MESGGAGCGGLRKDAAELKTRFLIPGSVQPVVADLAEALRKDVEQKAPNEFLPGDCHRSLLPAVSVVAVGKSDGAVSVLDNAVGRNGHAVGVAGNVVESAVF